MPRRPVADEMRDVGGATAWVAQQVAGANIAEDVRYNIEVCVEEALANLIEHARPIGDAKEIAISVEADGAGATVVVTDHCVSFDSSRPAPSSTPDAEAVRAGEIRPGGRGLRLMRAFATSLTYRTTEGRNELVMRFQSPA